MSPYIGGKVLGVIPGLDLLWNYISFLACRVGVKSLRPVDHFSQFTINKTPAQATCSPN